MTAQRAVASWLRGVIERTLVENGNYPGLVERDLVAARTRVESWGDFGKTVADEVRAAMPGTSEKVRRVLEALAGADVRSQK